MVEELTVIPGRRDVLHVAFGRMPDTYRPISAQFSMAPGSHTTLNGEPVTVGELLAWLADDAHEHYVTVHPDPQRYWLSLQTEFTDEEPTP